MKRISCSLNNFLRRELLFVYAIDREQCDGKVEKGRRVTWKQYRSLCGLLIPCDAGLDPIFTPAIKATVRYLYTACRRSFPFFLFFCVYLIFVIRDESERVYSPKSRSSQVLWPNPRRIRTEKVVGRNNLVPRWVYLRRGRSQLPLKMYLHTAFSRTRWRVYILIRT